MATIVGDRIFEERMISERRRLGLDRHDEIWEGVYFMSPAPNNEHQSIGGQITAILIEMLTRQKKGRVFPSCNISDRKDWIENYRIPDVAVFLNGNRAIDRGTHWIGGPDLAVEIVSEDDRSWEKLPFYAGLETREVLLLDRDPWLLTLCRLAGDELPIVGQSSLTDQQVIETQTVPLLWKLVTSEGRPAIEIRTLDSAQKWLIEGEEMERLDE